MAAQLPLAVTLGEPAGVGPDIALQLYAQRLRLGIAPFALYGPPGFFAKRAERLGLDIRVKPVLAEFATRTFENALPVVSLDGPVSDDPGHPDPANVPAIIESIERAVADTKNGVMRAVVTAPIHKAVMRRGGFNFPGHTEYLAELCANGDDAPHPVMMLVAGNFRTVPVTVHVPLVEAPWRLTANLVASTCRTVHRELKERFGIDEPRIAMTGLNPHAGEDGDLGEHEKKLLEPVLKTLAGDGIVIEGPLPADSAFTAKNRALYDAFIAMYHDQALIPIKALAFDEAVNVTLGLPIVRTSPDHGTALDLAGTGKASLTSFRNAMRLAEDLSG